MLSIIIDTFNQMPGWAQFLITWPLPALICTLIMFWLFKDDLNSNHRSHREGTRIMITFFTFFWPVFVFIALIATIIETYKVIPKLWQRFDTWANNAPKRHQMRMKLKQQPKAKPQIEYIHLIDRNRTLCGVGNPTAVKTTWQEKVVTCPTCLFIIRRDSRG